MSHDNISWRSLVYQKYWMKTYLEDHEFEDQDYPDFIVVEANSWSIVVPELEDGRLLVIRQYRPAWRSESYEFPGGRVEEGEDGTIGALRELEEESGYRAATIRLLGKARPVTWTTQRMEMHHATGLTKTRQNLDEDEHIEVLSMEPAEIEKLIAEGKMMQLASITAFHFWKMQLNQ